MTPSSKAYDIIKSFEGLYLRAYLDPIGIPTIGYGSIHYPNGVKIKMGDKITEAQANEMLKYEVDKKASAVIKMLPRVSQHQFDALVSFAFNLGEGNLKKSTLLRKIKINPNDPSIRNEFMKWNRAGGQVLRGLTRRRKAEADLYFS